METFYSKLLQGKIQKELIDHEFNDAVDLWHKGLSNLSLAEYLGMPHNIYAQVLTNPQILETWHNKQEITVEDLIVILKTMPQNLPIVYDWGQTISAERIELIADMKVVNLNR